MIVRALIRLLTLAALAWAGWLIARMFKSARQRQQTERPQVEPSGGAMVRDRVCNTFLPQDRALAHRVGDETHYFCSETCRSRFLEGAEAEKTA